MKSLIPLILFLFASTSAQSEKPNIVIIFTDDQGYADLGCYGSKTNLTPRLDQLAGGHAVHFLLHPELPPLLLGKGWGMPAEEITFAELIGGYQTACIGKWDVSNRKPIIERRPRASIISSGPSEPMTRER